MSTIYMILTLPTEGASTDVWDTLLNAALTTIDAHDHTTGKGAKVPTAGINVNADLTLNSYRCTSANGIAFSSLGALLSSGIRELFSYGGDLYFRKIGRAHV